MPFFTEAGNKFAGPMTEWLQDTRLMSEAVFRLCGDHKKTGLVNFSPRLGQSLGRATYLSELALRMTTNRDAAD